MKSPKGGTYWLVEDDIVHQIVKLVNLSMKLSCLHKMFQSVHYVLKDIVDTLFLLSLLQSL